MMGSNWQGYCYREPFALHVHHCPQGLQLVLDVIVFHFKMRVCGQKKSASAQGKGIQMSFHSGYLDMVATLEMICSRTLRRVKR